LPLQCKHDFKLPSLSLRSNAAVVVECHRISHCRIIAADIAEGSPMTLALIAASIAVTIVPVRARVNAAIDASDECKGG
jgi:hypothetical protein